TSRFAKDRSPQHVPPRAPNACRPRIPPGAHARRAPAAPPQRARHFRARAPPAETIRGPSPLSNSQTVERETTMDDKVKRARTEALFRDVNERIAESAQRFSAASTQFVCECADASCTHRLEATLDEYEHVREDGATFMLAPGHAHDDIERVVEDRGGFHIVEKVQSTVRATVQRLNPRAEPA